MLPIEGFDPPTFGLWAQHASSAPHRYTSIAHFLLYKGFNIYKYFN